MFQSIDALVSAVALAVGVIACMTDIRTRRIPNLLTFGAAIGAVIFHGATNGFAGVQSAVLGWVVGTALFLPFFLLRGMGGGDVKLLAAFGAWLGASDVFWLAVYASIAGGALAIVVSLSRGYLGTALRNIRELLTFWWLVGPRPMPSLTLERSDAPRLAFAIPLFVGALVTVWTR